MTKANRKTQYLAGFCVSLAFMFIGAALSWPSPAIPKFKSGEANLQISDAQSSWVVSLPAAGALPGCYIGHMLSERTGRKRTVFFAAVPAILGSSIILLTRTPGLMYAARLLTGVSTGITAVVRSVPFKIAKSKGRHMFLAVYGHLFVTMIYITEIADKETRGALGMVVQVMNNLGSLLMYSIGPFVSYAALNSMLIAIPITYVLFCIWIPESPYYHLKDGRIAAARKEFMIIKGCKDEKWIDEQLVVIRAHVRESMENKTTLMELLTNIRYRKALYVVAGLKVVQYMTGILAIQSYLEIIFRQSSSISGPLASIVFGCVQLAAGIGATFLASYFGRRTLMLVSCFGVALSLTSVGVYFYLQDAVKITSESLSSISALPLIGILSFIIFYAVGIGNLPYVMQAELFPINVKTVASSLATMVSCVLSFLVAKCYQGTKDIFGHYTVFWYFAAVAYVGLLFIYLYVPETRGKTLEEVQDNMQEKKIEDKIEEKACLQVVETSNADA